MKIAKFQNKADEKGIEAAFRLLCLKGSVI